MHPHILKIYHEEFLPKYLSETLEFNRSIFSREDILSVLGKERESFRALIRSIRKTMNREPGSTIVSGTGSGALSTTLFQALHPDQLTEVDINPEVIRRRQRLNRKQSRRVAVCQDISQLSFEDESFDLSVAYAVFRYVHEPTKAIDELLRTLRPNGWLVIAEGRKKQIVDRAEKYIARQYPKIESQRLELPNVLLPNLTFAYFLIERNERHDDSLLDNIISDEMQSMLGSRIQTIFSLAESLVGSVHVLFLHKN